MHRFAKLTIAAAALVAMGSAGANAKLTAANRTGHSVWFTLYDAFGKSLTSGCLTDGGQKVWNGSFPSVGFRGELVYLRGELKQNSNCGGSTLSDTGRGGTISVGGDTVKAFTVISGTIHMS